jgi:DNA-directed RNA polymerase subunit beta'
VPSQDIVLGLYYLTMMKEGEPGEGMAFADMAEVQHALAAGAVTLHTKIKGRYKTSMKNGNPVSRVYETTPGRLMLGELLPRSPACRSSCATSC